MNNVLVLAVHPDDETLGCGGTLLKHKASGDKINWLIGTEATEEAGFSKEYILDREKEIETVAKLYGFNNVRRLGIPAAKVDAVPLAVLIDKISKIFSELKPEIIYLPFMGDAHSDHRIFFEAAHICAKTFRQQHIRKILMMETISETEFAPTTKDFAFLPNYFVNITEFLPRKLEIMKIFQSELGAHPFPRSIENIKAVATSRGATAGFKYAESFMILKELWQ